MPGVPRRALRRLRATWTTVVFLFEVFPMLPSRPFAWVTPRPVVDRVQYVTSRGPAEGELYRPAGPGPHPGVVVCLGVVPFGVDHPQVPRLGRALARSGFTALLYWSPAMRDFRLEPEDVGDIASAYEALLARPDIDVERSGLLGTCVGGAFALMAAAQPSIRERVSFVLAYAAYGSMWTLVEDIASASTDRGGGREAWEVDQLTRRVFAQTVTATLGPPEASRLREAYAERGDRPVPPGLSEEANGIAALLGAPDAAEASAALRRLPPALQGRLDAMSPVTYLEGLQAPLVILMHDRDDQVVPVGESRRLVARLATRAGLRYTEFTVFKHLDPTKGKPAPVPLARELFRFARAVSPVFQRVSDRKR